MDAEPANALPRQQIRDLTAINREDMIGAWGLDQWPARRLIARLCWPPAYLFAREVAAYDRHVDRHGLAAGAGWILRRHVGRVEVANEAAVPTEGPVLVTANHPGLADTMALFAALPRRDLLVVAARRPFLQALPATSRHLIYLSEEPHERLAAVRQVLGALQAGRCVVTFPGGAIEPDPAVLPGAVEALEAWSSSIGLFVRLAPAAWLVPAVISGVLSPAAQAHPLARLRPTRADRERFGAMLQILVPAYRHVTVRVAFGRLPRAADLRQGRDPRHLTGLVTAEVARLMRQPPAAWRTVLHGLPPPRARRKGGL